MPQGSVWIKNDSGVWVTGTPYFKHATSGWLRGVEAYEKNVNDTTWDLIYDADITPPSSPQVSGSTNPPTYDNEAMRYRPLVILPSESDTVAGCMKVSSVGYPTNPGVLDGDCQTTVQYDGYPAWLWQGTPGSGATQTRSWGPMVGGRRYYASFWAQDDSGNWSAPTTRTFVFPNPATPTPSLVTKTAYVNTTDSASYANFGWRSGYDVYQGGGYNDQGFWFYGTQIKSKLANAHSITSIQVYVQRKNTSHGVSGDANIRIGRHGFTTQPSGSPGSNPITGEYVALTLKRGEAQWETLPSAWYSYFKSGTYRGVGLQYDYTSYTSSNYAICNGYGTSSGRIKLTWKEYE